MFLRQAVALDLSRLATTSAFEQRIFTSHSTLSFDDYRHERIIMRILNAVHVASSSAKLPIRLLRSCLSLLSSRNAAREGSMKICAIIEELEEPEMA